MGDAPQGATYSDSEIKAALKTGHIVCDPTPIHISGSSVDVTLGYYFYVAGQSATDAQLFNPFDKADVLRYFGDYKIAKPWRDVRKKITNQIIANRETLTNIPEDHPVIVLRPNERILAHTHEFIGIVSPGTSSMQARSTTGRIGISACYCAGWGDPGYVNRWTLEVHNLNESEYIVLPVGYRIAQIVFSSTGPVEAEYSLSSGNYQAFSAHDLAQIKKHWSPEQLLPRAYRKGNFSIPKIVHGLTEGIR